MHQSILAIPHVPYRQELRNLCPTFVDRPFSYFYVDILNILLCAFQTANFANCAQTGTRMLTQAVTWTPCIKFGRLATKHSLGCLSHQTTSVDKLHIFKSLNPHLVNKMCAIYELSKSCAHIPVNWFLNWIRTHKVLHDHNAHMISKNVLGRTYHYEVRPTFSLQFKQTNELHHDVNISSYSSAVPFIKQFQF